MGFMPLDLANIASGWCGDNAFKFRTGAGSMGHVTATNFAASNSCFGNRTWHYEDLNTVDYRGFPSFLGRTDVSVQEHADAAASGNPNPYLEVIDETDGEHSQSILY